MASLLRPAHSLEVGEGRGEAPGEQRDEPVDALRFDHVVAAEAPTVVERDERLLHVAEMVVGRGDDEVRLRQVGIEHECAPARVDGRAQSNSRLRATAALARCASARSGSSARAARASVSARPAQRSTSSGVANRRYSSAQAMASPARASAYSGSTRRAVSNASTAARVPAGVDLDQGGPAGQVRRVRRGVARIPPPQPFLFRGRQLEAQRSGDALGDDRLGVVELVGAHAHAIRPDDPVRRRVLEPRRHGDVATVDDDVAVEHQRSAATLPRPLGADDEEPLSAEPGGDRVGQAEARGAVVVTGDKGTDDEGRARDRRPADGGSPRQDGGQREEGAGDDHPAPRRDGRLTPTATRGSDGGAIGGVPRRRHRRRGLRRRMGRAPAEGERPAR